MTSALRLATLALAFSACTTEEVADDTGSAPALETCGQPAEHPHDPAVAEWSYHESENGPAVWGELAGDALCADGVAQTPIDIVGTASVAMDGDLAFVNYDTAVPLDLLNNGHTLQVDYAGSGSASDPQITFGGETYYLIQFHAHATSEHTIDGVSSAFELHFVHQSVAGALAVVGVLLDEGAPDETLELLFERNPGHAMEVSCDDTIRLDEQVPTASAFYHYSGSLTTPPCSEGVQWFVMDTHGTAAGFQADEWEGLFDGTTNRPVQPLNDRVIEGIGM